MRARPDYVLILPGICRAKSAAAEGHRRVGAASSFRSRPRRSIHDFTEAALAGAFLIDMERIEDDRGFFARSFCAEEFAGHGLAANMPQCSVSFNACRRRSGLHYQSDPHAEEKLVRCTAARCST